MLYREFINNAPRICDYAIKLGYLQDNPLKKITVPKRKVSVHEEDTSNFFSKEELEIFLKSVENKKDIRMYSFFEYSPSQECGRRALSHHMERY